MFLSVWVFIVFLCGVRDVYIWAGLQKTPSRNMAHNLTTWPPKVSGKKTDSKRKMLCLFKTSIEHLRKYKNFKKPWSLPFRNIKSTEGKRYKQRITEKYECFHKWQELRTVRRGNSVKLNRAGERTEEPWREELWVF